MASRSPTGISSREHRIDPSRAGTRCPAFGVTDVERLKPLLRAGPLCLIPRRLDPRIAAALDALPASDLPTLRFQGSPAELRRVLPGVLDRHRAIPAGLARWFLGDVIEQAELLAAFTGASACRLRLDVVRDDRCRSFHVDDVRFRLVTTYRGPGTEWIPPRVAIALTPGQRPASDAVRHLQRGTIAILRGGKGAGPDRPGVMHRSPPIAGTGTVRLLLSIDEAGRVLH